jgi:hypothetical protein
LPEKAQAALFATISGLPGGLSNAAVLWHQLPIAGPDRRAGKG